MADSVTLRHGPVTAQIDAVGAQLRSLRWEGVPVLYEGDAPEFWAKSAPLLFPVVGRCVGDHLTIGGVSYPMPRHGFARDLLFAHGGSGGSWARFELTASERTRLHYPFDFALVARYELWPDGIDCTYRVENRGSEPMPFSIGLHPAFRWPLGGAPRSGWRVRFARPIECERFHLDDGLRGVRRSSVSGESLSLSDELFEDDALVLRAPGTSRLLLEHPESPFSVRVEHSPVSWLGIWSIPRAPFVCLEPWQGVAGAAGDSGDVQSKEGMLWCPPGERYAFRMGITIRVASSRST